MSVELVILALSAAIAVFVARRTTSYAERVIIALSAAIAVFAVQVRFHDMIAFPALHDFDGPGHALNVVELFEGHLPNLRSWSGSQPPLYHAVGAALWAVLPAWVPVHVTLRLISVVSWVTAVGLVWRSLRRLVSETDAAVVATLLLGTPGILIGSCMMTNDALCALLVTATLVRLVDQPGTAVPSTRHAALTGVFAGLAAMTKVPGVAAIAIAAGWYAWRWRRDAAAAARAVAAFALVAAAIAGPHYARLVVTPPGSLFDIMADMAGSQEKRADVAKVLTYVSAEKLRRWMPAVLHAAVWGDPVGVFLRFQPDGLTGSFEREFGAECVILLGMMVLMVAGLGVLGVAAVGIARLAVQRTLAARLAAPLVFGAFVGASLLRVAWIFPSIMVSKPTTLYMLPAVLPVGIVLALGVAAMPGSYRPAVRGALLAIAAVGATFTWYGWWIPFSPVPPVVLRAPPGSAVETVARYFRLRAQDPIRVLPLVDTDVQLAHGLRVAQLLDIAIVPDRDLSREDERALEIGRARTAWMDLYHMVVWLQPVTSALSVSVIGARQDATDARVSVRVSAAPTRSPWGRAWAGAWPFPPFEQEFTLRADGGGWKIVAIEERGVTDQNMAPAFAAYPTLAGFERLRALGWKPRWDGKSPPTSGTGRSPQS